MSGGAEQGSPALPRAETADTYHQFYINESQ